MRRTTVLVLLGVLCCATPLWAAFPLLLSCSSRQIQTFAVPSNSPRLKITAVGASGGVHYVHSSADAYRGAGMVATSNFYVSGGTVLNILVGCEGGTSGYIYNSANGGGGGGGGSFVWNAATQSPLLVAGGGGGGSTEDYAFQPIYAKGIDASPVTSGNNNYYGTGAATLGNSAVFPGGKGFSDTISNPNPVACSGYGCGAGGYPGAGGSQSTSALAGGGSGYSGGAGGISNYPAGGGGGSYSSGQNPSFTLSSVFGDGYVLIDLAPACDDNSDFDALNSTCLCRSGWGNVPNPGCLSGPGFCSPNVPKMNVTYAYPVIDTRADSPNLPQIRGDALVLQLTGPYVQTRRYTMVNFQGADPLGSCNFNGKNSYWVKTFDTADTCFDFLTLTMPWSSHTACGFSAFSQPDNTVVVYKAKLLLNFAETLGSSFGVSLVRSTQHSYDVYVYFPSTLTVTLNNTQVVATVQLDVVLTNQQYDSTNQALVLQFTTVTPWSGRLSPVMNAFAPDGILVWKDATESTKPGTTCTTTSGTSCAQTFDMSFQLAQNASLCNFDGRYTLSATMYACRTAAGCSSAPVSVTFQLNSGKVCASVAVRPTIHGSLQAFPSTNSFGGAPITSFKLGDRVFFLVSTDAGTAGNHVNITFNSITYTTSSDGTVELYNSAGDQNGGLSAAGVKANVFISNANKYFFMYFSGEQFQIPFGTKVAFTFTASCTVTFFGSNKKREVEMVWEMDNADYYGTSGLDTSFGTMIELFRDEAALKDNTAVFTAGPQPVVMQGLSLVHVAGIAIGGVVVGVVLVMAVVFSVYKKMQRQLIAAQAQVSQPLLA